MLRGVPHYGKMCYVADGAKLLGPINFGDWCSVWFNSVVRADGGPITIGNRTNIQDGAIVHCLKGGQVVIGNDVSIGHGAILHGCTIDDRVLVGSGAIILDGAHIESDTVVGAGAIVTSGRLCKSGLYVGAPAIAVPLSEELFKMIMITSDRYVAYAKSYMGCPDDKISYAVPE
jgi:carbonic anhydrase/acetyltransferase-like protein (isoleucine patch superfamily)